jgi:hypothetical protein
MTRADGHYTGPLLHHNLKRQVLRALCKPTSHEEFAM